MGKILISSSHFDTLCMDAWNLIEARGHEVIYDPKRGFPAYTSEELKEILPDIDGTLIGLDHYTEDLFAAAPKLTAVAKFGVGVDNIDVEAATRHGVWVINAPGINSNSVAELTVAFMLNLLRSVVPLHEKMAQGTWQRFIGSEIKGKTVGLLGFGAIARSVAEKLKAFDAHVIAFDLYPNEEAARQLNVTLTTMDEVIETSDIVSIHIPATAENRHLFCAQMFARMKKGAYLVNTARGALVSLADLRDALLSGQLSGAALDAFEEEPLPMDSPIFQCPNVILTPHTGAETADSYRRVALAACECICDVLDGKEPRFHVNFL